MSAADLADEVSAYAAGYACATAGSSPWLHAATNEPRLATDEELAWARHLLAVAFQGVKDRIRDETRQAQEPIGLSDEVAAYLAGYCGGYAAGPDLDGDPTLRQWRAYLNGHRDARMEDL